AVRRSHRGERRPVGEEPGRSAYGGRPAEGRRRRRHGRSPREELGDAEGDAGRDALTCKMGLMSRQLATFLTAACALLLPIGPAFAAQLRVDPARLETP